MSANISTAIANRAMEWGLGSLSLSRDSGYVLTFKTGSFFVPALLLMSHVQLQVAVRHISSSLARALTHLLLFPSRPGKIRTRRHIARVSPRTKLLLIITPFLTVEAGSAGIMEIGLRLVLG